MEDLEVVGMDGMGLILAGMEIFEAQGL